MFNNLIESKPKKQRSLGATVFSAIFHGLVIGLSVYATAGAVTEDEEPIVQKVEFVDIKKDEPPPADEPPPPPPDMVAAPPPPQGFQVLTAPVNIPDMIPEIDLSKKLTNEADFSGRGVAGGIASGVVGGTAPVTDQTYFDFQVEKVVAPIPGIGDPRYPDLLRSGNVEGLVLAQFVVDTTGRVEISSFRVVTSTHDLFVAAVRQQLPNMRFLSAEVGGRKVKQLVARPFQFTLNK